MKRRKVWAVMLDDDSMHAASEIEEYAHDVRARDCPRAKVIPCHLVPIPPKRKRRKKR